MEPPGLHFGWTWRRAVAAPGEGTLESRKLPGHYAPGSCEKQWFSLNRPEKAGGREAGRAGTKKTAPCAVFREAPLTRELRSAVTLPAGHGVVHAAPAGRLRVRLRTRTLQIGVLHAFGMRLVARRVVVAVDG